MKREFLQEFSLGADIIDKIMAENGKDIEVQKQKTAAAILERDGLKTQLDGVGEKLKAFEGVDVEKLKGEITTLTNDLSQKETEYRGKLAKLERQRETEAFFNGLEREFTNYETKEYYFSKLETLLDEEKSKGKSRQELLDVLTKNEKGEVRPGVFKEPDNPNKLIIPPVGAGGGGNIKALKDMSYAEEIAFKAQFPEQYNLMKEGK